MLDTVELAYVMFQTEKKHGPFIYEMRLVQLDLTSEFNFQRRWYYLNQSVLPDWKEADDWNLKDKNKFKRKLVQKRDIMKFDIVQSRGLEMFDL